MPRKEEDKLGQDFTRTGEPQTPKPPESQRSLGDQSTFGDAGSSVSDVGGLHDAFDSDMEVVDLSDRYEIEGVIGKGGMGEVQRARDTRLNRPVAIKRVLGEMARSKKALARFLTEAQSVAALNHFNIVQIYDYGRAADGPFIIMELVEGQSLQDKLKEGPLELEAAVEMTCQLCDALSTAHEAGIIHRDIKPANILLTQRGEAKLTDFGLARQATADHGQTMAGAVLGTIDFMPPEQRQDATLTDARSDLWALAATLYQMVTGRAPKVIRLDVVNESLRPVMGQALEENPDDRYQTATEFRHALRDSLTASAPAPEVAVDLGAGECPQCHAKNESNRKFCRGCGSTLVQKCLSCKAEVPIWENFCGACGEDQKKLAEARRAEMASRQQEAEKLLKQYDYAEATQVATDLRDETDSRFQQLKEWADQLLQDVEQQRKQQLGRIADLVQEALQHEKAYDYQAGINTLEQIPKTLRERSVHGQSSSASGLLDRLQEKLSESERLEQLIRQRVKAKQVTGLLSEVEGLLILQPNRKSILKLRDQLIARDEKNSAETAETLTKASGLRQECRFEAVAELLKRIPKQLSTPEVNKLLQDCKTLGALRARALASLAGAIQTGDYETGLSQADKYRTTLKTRGFVDKSFADEYESSQEASAVAERQQVLRKKLAIAGALITLALLLGAGLAIKIATDWAATKRAVARVKKYMKPEQLEIGDPIVNRVGVILVPIPAGEFMMGSPESEPGRGHDETQHRVRITKAFYLSVHEVTQQQYEQVMGNNPSRHKGANKPAENISWDNAVEFSRKLSNAEGVEYRLPTEAEWEYACRAGTTTSYSFGDDASQLNECAWYGYNSKDTTHAVGEKLPNPWGLADMHGNVWEWCQNWYAPYETENAIINPTGPKKGEERVLRGGAFTLHPMLVRAAYRLNDLQHSRNDSYGFRLARTYDLSRNNSQKLAVAALEKLGAEIKRNKQGEVYSVYFTDTRTTDAGLVHLQGLTKLKYLNLDDTHVTDAGLLHLEVLTNLTKLTLGNTPITDAGLVHLKGLTNQEYLSLHGTQISDAGLVHLEGLTNLQKLYLDGTQITGGGLVNLRKALPKCDIRP